MGEEKIKTFKEVCGICHKLQNQGKKIVFCHGFFDILHMGHLTLLVEAKKLGDILVVGLDHNDNAKILKGPNRPINDQKSRMFVLANLEPVDYVFLVTSLRKVKVKDHEKFWLEKYKILKPDIIASTLKAGKFGEQKKRQAEKARVKFVDIDQGIYDKNTSKTLKILGLE